MADVRHTEIFDCTPEQFFQIIADYGNYPEFLKDVKSCKVIEGSGEIKKVEFNISIVKNFKYISEHTEKSPREMSWKFVEGDLFKSMNGHWRLEEEGGKTKAEYFVEARFGLLVPKSMVNSALKANLPAMMKAYHKRVQALFPYVEPKEEVKEEPKQEVEEEVMEAKTGNESKDESKVELDWDADASTEKKGISESVKQLFVSALSSGFVSEDNLKQYVQDLKLPKDVLNQVVKGAQKSKDDLVARVSNELTKMISKIDLVKEFTKLLRDHKISIKADIDFTPKKKESTVVDSEETEIDH